MTLALPVGLPARRRLERERIPLLAQGAFDHGAFAHDAEEPLRILLINLMPAKVVSETQLARVLGQTDAPIELTLCIPDGYNPRNTPADHIAAFYRPWSELCGNRYDGLIVTGAPVETLPFEEVSYWPQLTEILDWAERNVASAYMICWAGQAALYHYYGVPKHQLESKMFGVFPHRVTAPDSPLMADFGRSFVVPVSRHTEVRAEDLPAGAGLRVLAQSPQSGLCMIEDERRRFLYMFNHLEYDANTLALEYRRDLLAGQPIELPRRYYPKDDASKTPRNRWRPHANRFFRNWVAEMRRARAG
jgi:homoserine O-succinyltransferase